MKKPIYLLIVLILIIPIVLAIDNSDDIIEIGPYKQNINLDIKVSCRHTGGPCSSGALCNLTVEYPNSTYMVFDKEMTQNRTFYNYTLPDSSVIGKHSMIISCFDSSYNVTKQYNFFITETGDKSSTLFIFIIELLMKAGFFIFLIILSIWGIKAIKKAEKTPYHFVALLRTLWASASYAVLFTSPIIGLFLFHPNFNISILRNLTLRTYIIIFIILGPIILFNILYFSGNLLLKFGGLHHDAEKTNMVLNDMSRFGVSFERIKNKMKNKLFRDK